MCSSDLYFFEMFRLGADVLPAGLWPVDAEAELEVFFVTCEDVGHGCDPGKDVAQRALASFPERGAVIQVERDPCAVLFGHARQLEAKFARLVRECRD